MTPRGPWFQAEIEEANVIVGDAAVKPILDPPAKRGEFDLIHLGLRQRRSR